MASKKPSVGYTTPATEIQDAFVEVQKELIKTKTNWQAIDVNLSPTYKSFAKDIEKKITSGRHVSANEVTILSVV